MSVETIAAAATANDGVETLANNMLSGVGGAGASLEATTITAVIVVGILVGTFFWLKKRASRMG